MAVLAIFRYEEDFLAGAERVKTAGIGRISLMSPLPLEDAQEVLGMKASPVRRFSLAGAIFGALSGFAMAVGTALVFILPTGGRAIITVPPYLIITYEMTILLGVCSRYSDFLWCRGCQHGETDRIRRNRTSIASSWWSKVPQMLMQRALRQCSAKPGPKKRGGWRTSMSLHRTADFRCDSLHHACDSSSGWSLPWDRDMQNQPSVKAQESVVETDSESVPVGESGIVFGPQRTDRAGQSASRSGREIGQPDCEFAGIFGARTSTLRGALPRVSWSAGAGRRSSWSKICAAAHGPQSGLRSAPTRRATLLHDQPRQYRDALLPASDPCRGSLEPDQLH